MFTCLFVSAVRNISVVKKEICLYWNIRGRLNIKYQISVKLNFAVNPIFSISFFSFLCFTCRRFWRFWPFLRFSLYEVLKAITFLCFPLQDVLKVFYPFLYFPLQDVLKAFYPFYISPCRRFWRPAEGNEHQAGWG